MKHVFFVLFCLFCSLESGYTLKFLFFEGLFRNSAVMFLRSLTPKIYFNSHPMIFNHFISSSEAKTLIESNTIFTRRSVEQIILPYVQCKHQFQVIILVRNEWGKEYDFIEMTSRWCGRHIIFVALLVLFTYECISFSPNT